MTYKYSVLYLLNLSWKHFFPTENGNFCENIQIRRPFSIRVLTRSRMPNRRTSQSKTLILRYSQFESDGCRIIYLFFLRDPGQNIYFKVFDGQDIYFKKLPAAPPPPESTVRPLTKKGPVSTIPQ